MPPKNNALSKITVEGFKSIHDRQTVEIRPLTLLAGANSSGKSSIMQPLLLLKQTIEAPSDPGPLLLDGPNVRFTEAKQLLSHIGKNSRQSFSVSLEKRDADAVEVEFKRVKPGGVVISSMRSLNGKVPLHITPDMSHEEIMKVLPGPLNNFLARISTEEKDKLHWGVHRERCFLGFKPYSDTGRPTVSFGQYGISPSALYVPLLQAMIHLPGLRGNPRRTYPKNASGPHFPGTFEDYVASIITQWQNAKDSRLQDLGAALEDMGLTWKVEAKPIDDTQVELRVGRLVHSKQGGAHDLVSIADVGFGLSQSLPVVLALVAANPGQIVYLEQPEIHLHPLAQRKLANILAAASKRGVVVIVETHSALLLKEIQTLVAKDELPKDLVKLHWFHREKDGRTIIESTDLDEKGAYGLWPADFDKVDLDAESQYLDAVEAREAP